MVYPVDPRNNNTSWIEIWWPCLKLNALACIAPFMNVSKKRIIVKSFVESQFEHCTLIWMFHSRRLNKINHTYERAWRIAYNGKSSSYRELLTHDRSVTIHHGNIKANRNLPSHTGNFPATFKWSVLIVWMFWSVPRQCSYNPRGNKCLERRRVKSVRYGTEAISFLAPKILEFLRNEIKDSNTLQIFKAKIKTWVTVECPVHYTKSFYVKEDLYICNYLYVSENN